jgi:sulfite reductase (NADPH) flavoprotein alpha-component
MLADSKLKTLHHLVGDLTKEELIWINGYLSGLVNTPALLTDKQPVLSRSKVTIAFGSETGNAKKLATHFAAKAKQSGINARLSSLDQYRLTDLAKEEYFFLIISTHGEGEPPAAAKKFYDYIHENELRLDKLQYSVLALGDTAYPLFCKTGEIVDIKFENLGAKRLTPLQKCDTDFEEDANAWFNSILKNISIGPVSTNLVAQRKPSAKKKYLGTVLSKINLNGTGSLKETYHIEIAAEDLAYQPGDSIGIVPENPTEMVSAILDCVNIAGATKRSFKGEEFTLFDLLKKKLNIVYLPERVVKQYASMVQQDIPIGRIDLLNLLKIYPVKDADQFEEVINLLEPIVPRLYSISSSSLAHVDEVHITVAKNCFVLNDERKNGLCSDYLSQLKENSSVEFYVQKNGLFKLPAPGKDIIMMGPGTGVAPFRAFIEERDALGASGKSWLFFGDQHFATDFLYQTEIQNYLQTGALSNATVAFSRDQPEKIYVQHKMWEHRHEIYQWLEEGAHLYICGAKDPMSIDVENTLLKIFEEAGNKTTEEAQTYLGLLAEEGRYAKDVY